MRKMGQAMLPLRHAAYVVSAVSSMGWLSIIFDLCRVLVFFTKATQFMVTAISPFRVSLGCFALSNEAVDWVRAPKLGTDRNDGQRLMRLFTPLEIRTK